MKTIPTLLIVALGYAGAVRADDTPLGKQMEEFNDAYKAFRKEKDPAKGAELAREAQGALVKSFALEPEMVSKMPDGPEKSKALAAYRGMIAKTLATLCEVESAFLDGKVDQVAELVDALKDQKKTGHDRFMEE